jgi:hypothetical protein
MPDEPEMSWGESGDPPTLTWRKKNSVPYMLFEHWFNPGLLFIYPVGHWLCLLKAARG